MAKPRPPHNRTNISEGPGDGAEEEVGEESAKVEEEGAAPPPPPTTRRREGGGARGSYQQGVREGAPPPLGGRGTPEEQARSTVARIVNFPSGGGPPSGQTPAPTQQDQHI